MRPVGNVDKATQGRLAGWAAGSCPVTVEAWSRGRCIAKTRPGIPRKDVAAAYPAVASAGRSGFSLELPIDSIRGEAMAEVRVVVRPSLPFFRSASLGTFYIVQPTLPGSLNSAPSSNVPTPFPRQITDAIAALWPDDCSHLETAEGQRRFVRRLKGLLAAPGINSEPVVAQYARYLSSTYAHCRFVEKHFPATNTQAAEDGADFCCKPNSIHELFPIIHQLYVLRSHGITGDFLEAGCFKGYSTSMLSFACREIGIKMHVLDSFEGLPPASGSGYEARQFSGGLDEVRSNVARFGAIESIEFHKGFFADTLKNWRPSELMCLWMDVDLESSAMDLMALADTLHPRGTVFSHECVSEFFRNGRFESLPAADNPVTPMLARYEDLGRPLTGRHVSGFTGAFWPISGGVPVIDTEVLFELVRSL